MPGHLIGVYARQALISVSVTCILQIAAMVGDSKSALTTQVRSFCNVSTKNADFLALCMEDAMQVYAGQGGEVH